MGQLNFILKNSLLLVFFALSACVTLDRSIDEMFADNKCDISDDGVTVVCDDPDGKAVLANSGWEEAVEEAGDIDAEALAKKVHLGGSINGRLMKVTADCDVRKTPDAKGTKVVSLKKGSEVYVDETAGNWYSASVDQGSGYLAKECFLNNVASSTVK